MRAVIFDMDGVIVDSEPLWREVEIEVFGEHGLALTDADCRATQGMRIDRVVEHWRAQRGLMGASTVDIAATIVGRVAEAVAVRGAILEPARRAIERLRCAGVPLGLATSSPWTLIRATLARAGLTEAFRAVCSAEDEAHGKPHPAVYLTAASRLGVDPRDCVVVEDSVSGVIAGKAAGMRVVAVPSPEQRQDARFAIADLRLDSLDGWPQGLGGAGT